MARQNTPDIMADLMLSTKPSSNKTIEQYNEGLASDLKGSREQKPENKQTIELSNNKAIKQEINAEVGLKEKVTFNLSQSTILKLEDVWIQLKRQLKGSQRVTKTAIVEMALEICIEELAKKETESAMYKAFSKL